MKLGFFNRIRQLMSFMSKKEQDTKDIIVNLLKEALKEENLKIDEEEIKKFIEVPKSFELGDYAFPCFFLVDKIKEEPHQIAIMLRSHMTKLPSNLEDVQVAGPYINFFLDRKEIARQLIWEVLRKKQNFGKSSLGNRKKVVVEFSSPNIGKPFGIGHLRSTIIGNSIANICEFVGFKPIRLNYLGDWGAQFGKLIFGYIKFGNEKKLHEDPLKHLMSIYVRMNKNKKYDKESKEWFKKLEQGDRQAVILWRAFRELSLNEFKKIYDIFGIRFKDYTGESATIRRKSIDKILQEMREKKLLRKSKGALIVNLKKYSLGVCLMQKEDGTTIYAVRDIISAIRRQKKYKFKRMIYEVGQEQTLYFKQIFKILELMGYEWAKDCIHVSHGLYLDKDGRKFATRKGKTILMKDIIDKIISLSKKEIKKRFPKISKRELEDRALKIAIAAIFYGDLKNNRLNDVVFDLQRFVSFEGDTGPYILYSYARASSILEKSVCNDKFKVYDLEPKEVELVKKLSEFPQVVLNAYENMNPSLIANYSYQLAKIFNEFYHNCQVIGSEEEVFRLTLIESFRQTLRNALRLLGIKTIENM